MAHFRYNLELIINEKERLYIFCGEETKKGIKPLKKQMQDLYMEFHTVREGITTENGINLFQEKEPVFRSIMNVVSFIFILLAGISLIPVIFFIPVTIPIAFLLFYYAVFFGVMGNLSVKEERKKTLRIFIMLIIIFPFVHYILLGIFTAMQDLIRGLASVGF